MSQNIHPLAVVEPGAKIGNNVTIEAFAVIKEHVTLCDGVTIRSHAFIDGHTTIGEGSIVYPFASIGTKPQALKFKGEYSTVVIGKNTEIREYVTVNAGLGEGSSTIVGDNCFIMAYCHVAHNSVVGNHCIFSNGVTLGGHVVVEDHVVIGGLTPVHQWVRIGTYSMVGGLSRIVLDVPPYTLCGGSPLKFGGLNLVGLRRNGFTFEVRKALAKAYRYMYRSELNVEQGLLQLEGEYSHLPEVAHWIAFARASKRGISGLGNEGEGSSQTEESNLSEAALASV